MHPSSASYMHDVYTRANSNNGYTRNPSSSLLRATDATTSSLSTFYSLPSKVPPLPSVTRPYAVRRLSSGSGTSAVRGINTGLLRNVGGTSSSVSSLTPGRTIPSSITSTAAPMSSDSPGGSAVTTQGGRGSTPSSSSSGSLSSASSSLTCDKCDGKHETAKCPIYKKPREQHPDAWVNKGRKTPKEMGGGGGNFVLRSARVVTQPGDGSCLFHSMAHGLGGGSNARTLRREIAAFVERNPTLNIADDPLKDWVHWDSGCSVAEYSRRMAISGWGGGIEMAACSRLKGVNVHVYEKAGGGGFRRISCFDAPGSTRTIHVLYCGGVHYNSLVP